ncbi:MAG: YeeE/YedE thiosulfate transporter family protein, partial [Gemmataceae bacterium]
GVEEINGYFAAKAAEGTPPKVGWEWMLVLGVFVGAFISARLSGDHSAETVPALWRWRFGGSPVVRLVVAFFAGAVMMFGARLAGGCTSGHGISGSLQLAASSWVFSVVFFSVATATAFALYGREGADHV